MRDRDARLREMAEMEFNDGSSLSAADIEEALDELTTLRAQLSTLQAKVDALTAEPDEAMVEAAAFEAFKAEWSQGTWNAMQRESYIESARAWSAAFLRAARPA